MVEAENTLQTVQSQAINLGVARAQYRTCDCGAGGSESVAVFDSGEAVDDERRRRFRSACRRNCWSGGRILLRRSGRWRQRMRRSGWRTRRYYPTLTLERGRAASRARTSDICSTGRAGSGRLGRRLSETIYDGGLRRATVNQYIATYNADVASYRQTVLTAFQQVED